MDANEIEKSGLILDRAAMDAQELDRLTLVHPQLSVDEAYKIQDVLIRLREKRGERYVGLKMGLTSKAKMKQMGVNSPIYGVLTDSMRVEPGPFTLKRRIHPKIEPEIVFIVEKDIRGKVSREEALAACSGVCAGMEIIDSRYKNFNFTLPDVIADNCSSSGFVMGTVIKKPKELDLGNLGIVMSVNGKPVQFGSSSAILGHPGDSLSELCSMLHARGLYLKAGSIVLAGSATAAIPLEPESEVSTEVQDLGTVTLKITG